MNDKNDYNDPANQEDSYSEVENDDEMMPDEPSKLVNNVPN